MQALQAEPRFMKMASKVEKKNAVAQALHDEAEKLQRQAAKAEREADRERRRFKAEFRSEFIQRHGRLFPYTEVCTFFDVDAALDRRLSTLNIGETLKILCARPLCPVIGCPDLTEKDVYELCYCMERQ